MYYKIEPYPLGEILNAHVGSKMRVSIEATEVSLRNVGFGECHLTLTAWPTDKVRKSNKTFVQVYDDRDVSMSEKNTLLLSIYDKVKKERDLYDKCRLDLWITKKSPDTDIAGYTGQSYQYACSINESHEGRIKIYMHDDTLKQLNSDKSKGTTLDNFFGDLFGNVDIRRK